MIEEGSSSWCAVWCGAQVGANLGLEFLWDRRFCCWFGLVSFFGFVCLGIGGGLGVERGMEELKS